MQHRAKSDEILPVAVKPFEVEYTDIYCSCSLIIVVLELRLELLLLNRALIALHRKNLAVAWPIKKQNLSCALRLTEAIIELRDGSWRIVLNKRSKVVLTR